MPRVDRLVYLETPTTRRAVVVTGSRLAYAAPMVAASFRLSELRAQAEGGVSDVQLVVAAGLYPPTIESVSYTAPSWTLITGRNLSGATVTFDTDQGTVADGVILSNSDSEIVVSIIEGVTIFSTTVETPDGTSIFDQTMLPPEAAQALEDSPPAEPELAEQTQEEGAAAEVLVEEPIEAPATEPAIDQAAEVEQPPVEEQPPVVEEAAPIEAPVPEMPPPDVSIQESAPVAPAPVPDEIPVAEEQVAPTQFWVGAGVVVLDPGATMYQAPTESSPVVIELPAWSSLVIVGPMQAMDGKSWWQVQHLDSGLVGFVAETSLMLQA